MVSVHFSVPLARRRDVAVQGSERGGRWGSPWAPAFQTIYNAITNGTPCVVVEGSGRVADVIAQVASLPISEITISRIQQSLSVFFQEMFETLTEGRVVEWTKKVSSRLPDALGLGMGPGPGHRDPTGPERACT